MDCRQFHCESDKCQIHISSTFDLFDYLFEGYYLYKFDKNYEEKVDFELEEDVKELSPNFLRALERFLTKKVGIPYLGTDVILCRSRMN